MQTIGQFLSVLKMELVRNSEFHAWEHTQKILKQALEQVFPHTYMFPAELFTILSQLYTVVEKQMSSRYPPVDKMWSIHAGEDQSDFK